jgi:hypothetical protein
MQCPKDYANWKHFICEACTVRAVVQRELTWRATDFVLLMLERARIIDSANHWAVGTLKTYQSKFNVIGDFEKAFGVPVLPPTMAEAPPNGPDIRLMWVQERYSLYPSEWRKKNSPLETTVKFGSVRAVRSAASHFWIMDLLQAQPEKLTLGFKDRPTVVEGCSPTEELAFTYFTDGLKRRLGDHPKPSAVLLWHHIQWLDKYFLNLFLHATDPVVRANACRAGLTNLLAFLGWLRAQETFGLRWLDTTIIEPVDGPSVELAPGVGVILLRLAPQTKSSQAATADVVVAYETASGLSLGAWLHRLRGCVEPRELQAESFIIAHPSGVPWTSHHYRHTYFYPALAVLRATGDAFLGKYDETPGKRLREVFWGFNTYRRTGRSVVSKKRTHTVRKATPAEVVEHGRWRISRSSLDMPLAYLEWSILDRFCITFLCS